MRTALVFIGVTLWTSRAKGVCSWSAGASNQLKALFIGLQNRVGGPNGARIRILNHVACKIALDSFAPKTTEVQIASIQRPGLIGMVTIVRGTPNMTLAVLFTSMLAKGRIAQIRARHVPQGRCDTVKFAADSGYYVAAIIAVSRSSEPMASLRAMHLQPSFRHRLQSCSAKILHIGMMVLDVGATGIAKGGHVETFPMSGNCSVVRRRVARANKLLALGALGLVGQKIWLQSHRRDHGCLRNIVCMNLGRFWTAPEAARSW